MRFSFFVWCGMKKKGKEVCVVIGSEHNKVTREVRIPSLWDGRGLGNVGRDRCKWDSCLLSPCSIYRLEIRMWCGPLFGRIYCADFVRCMDIIYMNVLGKLGGKWKRWGNFGSFEENPYSIVKSNQTEIVFPCLKKNDRFRTKEIKQKVAMITPTVSETYPFHA